MRSVLGAVRDGKLVHPISCLCRVALSDGHRCICFASTRFPDGVCFMCRTDRHAINARGDRK